MKVYIKEETCQGILNFFKHIHPKEGVLLLRGKKFKDGIIIEGVIIPPKSVHGEGFSSFSATLLPADFSIVGLAHSHPFGALNPSPQDLNNFYGKVMMIACPPYTYTTLAFFSKNGEKIEFKLI
ncbi:MAG: Mov34/MPN/PAD-1 family protein [Candidatus Bathyarchaeota archaeon]